MTGSSAVRRLLDAWDGVVVDPPNVEDVLAKLDGSNADTMLERLRAATNADFSDVPHALAVLPSLAADETLHLARRLGWTLKALIDWSPNQDRSVLRIEAALASVAPWNVDGTFWEAVRPLFQECRLTIAAFEVVLRGRAPQMHFPEGTPIWEREHAEAMQEAERSQDWTELVERARAFRRLPSPDLGARQATLALSLLDWPRLVRLANGSEGWLHSHLLMAPLPLADALRLANASGNGYARFAALERVAYREVRSLLPLEETALKNLLIVLAKDANDWPRWLTICNRYPVRHPHMQPALGRALARSDGPALQAYVESITLGTADRDNRANVTRCLLKFRTMAVFNRRLALWRAAFERWDEWNFAKDEEKNLTSPAQSALDYGVVGWLIEGEQQKSIDELNRAFANDLQSLDMRWHASLTSAISDFFRLVSRYQVSAHASRRSLTDPDWLPGPSVDLPAAATDEFVQRRYRWGDWQQPAG